MAESPSESPSEARPAAPEPAPSGSRLATAARIGLVLAALVLLVVAGRAAGDRIPAFAAWVDSLGLWGPLVFVAGYAIAVVAFIPGSILSLAAGAVFGLAEGTLYVITGATLGCTLAFWVARYGARDTVQRWVSKNPRVARIDRAVESQGLKIVLLLRLSPVVPFNLLNYALGLTRVRTLHYVVACAAMLPGTLLYVYLGFLAGDVAAAAAAGGNAERAGWGYYAFLVLGFAATVAATVVVTRIARRALREEAGV